LQDARGTSSACSCASRRQTIAWALAATNWAAISTSSALAGSRQATSGDGRIVAAGAVVGRSGERRRE
jgi:hypothetical protein